MTRTTLIAHRVSIVLMAVLVLVATADGFAQSYAGLHRWALEHGLKGWKADSFPLLVDLFIAVGELGLFALALEGHRLTRRGLAWVDIALPFSLAAGGWGVSLAFNVGAVRDEFADQVTAAVAPVASMLGLLVMLRTVHRLVARPAADKAADVDHSGRTVAEPVDQTADEAPAVDSAGLWELMPADAPDGWPTDPAEPVADVDQDDAEDERQGDAENPDDGREIGHRPDGPTADENAPVDLDSAIRSARAAGRSVRSIAEEFGVSRYRVDKVTAGVPVAVNGHRVG
ncbi:DUF2637 domain-containing protein [Actinomadura sp. WAC 06369]|uniref:DUF2637 domain-containing protein n=1 Tax=Actinomadura sp. WAC 06369 TaxID=2203193 RepID=UPI000F7AD70C|nr:DUF2637 domain-containing protein [Actinomadura sp. WAC 06369]RSN71355.1 hypothetical protein DMH08_02840 [Actinomadura sp. WAC 06369]